MTDYNISMIKIERSMEKLRQESEIFNLRKKQESRWFVLRLCMGYSSIVLLITIILICSLILFNSKQYPTFTVQSAGAALFADVVGLLISVWKVVLKPDFITKLTTETHEEIPD